MRIESAVSGTAGALDFACRFWWKATGVEAATASMRARGSDNRWEHDESTGQMQIFCK